MTSSLGIVLRKNVLLKFSGKEMRQGFEKGGILFLKGIRAVVATPFPIHITQVAQGVFISKGIEDVLHKGGVESQCLQKQLICADGMAEMLFNPVLPA